MYKDVGVGFVEDDGGLELVIGEASFGQVVHSHSQTTAARARCLALLAVGPARRELHVAMRTGRIISRRRHILSPRIRREVFIALVQ